RLRQSLMNQAKYPMPLGHAQEPGPFQRPRCRCADGFSTAIRWRPHRTSSRQPEFGREWACHEGLLSLPAVCSLYRRQISAIACRRRLSRMVYPILHTAGLPHAGEHALRDLLDLIRLAVDAFESNLPLELDHPFNQKTT